MYVYMYAWLHDALYVCMYVRMYIYIGIHVYMGHMYAWLQMKGSKDLERMYVTDSHAQTFIHGHLRHTYIHVIYCCMYVIDSHAQTFIHGHLRHMHTNTHIYIYI